MEIEVRYYYCFDDKQTLLDKLFQFSELNYLGKFYEKTIQYNHPMEEYNFYSKEMDGRFRIRLTKSDDVSKCMISWKKRLKRDFW